MREAKIERRKKLIRRIVLGFFRYSLLIGLCYYILYPLLKKVAQSFMTEEDLLDSLVQYWPRSFTLANYKFVFTKMEYWKSLWNTTWISVMCGAIQMLSCTFVGYGLAKFPFKGRRIVEFFMLLMIIVPPITYKVAMNFKFVFFNGWEFLEIFGLTDLPSIKLSGSIWPLVVLSVTATAFKNGIFIFMMRQYFKNFPAELEEAAYVDGMNVFRTFFQVILPNSIPMMTTVFMFSFAWQWTDYYYTNMFIGDSPITLAKKLLSGVANRTMNGTTVIAGSALGNELSGTMALMVILPLLIIYAFAQRTLTEGIERSGIVG